MNFDPQKFFIGLMDFFSILLPGALLTWLLMGDVGPVVLGDRYAMLAGGEAWAAFLFASYLLGHLVFLLGSWLDGIYDWLRDRTLNWQIRHVASRGRVLSWSIRVCVSLVFKRERNLTVDRAGKIKQQAFGAQSIPRQIAYQRAGCNWGKTTNMRFPLSTYATAVQKGCVLVRQTRHAKSVG